MVCMKLTEPKEDELQHFGIPGMKWGIRRYQEYPSGKKGRYTGDSKTKSKKLTKVEKVAEQKKRYEKTSKKNDPSFDKVQQKSKMAGSALTIREVDKILKRVAEKPSRTYATELKIAHGKRLVKNLAISAVSITAINYVTKKATGEMMNRTMERDPFEGYNLVKK